MSALVRHSPEEIAVFKSTLLSCPPGLIPSQKPIKHILFKPDAKQYLTSKITGFEFDMFLCENWLDLTRAIALGAKQMVIHISLIDHLSCSITEIIEMISTQVAVMNQSKIAIMVAIESNTPVKFIKELKKTGVLGILPAASHWGFEEGALALSALTRRQSHWPAHIINQLPGCAEKKIKKPTSEIILTDRQSDVFKLIAQRGLSNKKIAQVLGISESTVKVHVSAILRSYRVRNRTQLALSAKAP